MPADITPYAYKLCIKAYVGGEHLYGNKSFTQESSTTVHFTCSHQTRRIVLHAVDLDISSIAVSSNGEDQEKELISEWSFDNVTQFLTFNLRSECRSSKNYTMNINYTVPISDGLLGFYRSSYKDPSGEIK